MSDEIREALEAAVKEHTPTESNAPVDTAVAVEPVEASGGDVASGPVAETAAEAAARARDEKGRFATKPGETKAVAPSPIAAKTSSTPAPQAGTQTTTPAPKYKAPQSWKPGLREKWSTLPEEIQAEVDRREREAAQLAQKSGEHGKLAEQFKAAYAPYEATIRSSGADPLKVFSTMMATEHQLRTSAPAQKAQLFAQLVKTYGVDIGALDEALSGAVPQGQPQQQAYDPEAIVQQAEQRLMQRLQEQRQQAFQAKAQQEIATVQEKEFFEDVRPYMATLMKAAAEQGIAMSLEQAYDSACQLHPDVNGVLSQRKATQPAPSTVSPVSTAKAKAAAMSVKSSPATAPEPMDDDADDIRGALKAAMAKHSGR